MCTVLNVVCYAFFFVILNYLFSMREVSTRFIPKILYPDFSHPSHILRVSQNGDVFEDPFARIRKLSAKA